MAKSNKLIIHNYTDLEDYEALCYIQRVIQAGLISETSKGKQYCFATRINQDYIITCDKLKTGYTFRIIKEN